jgi:hypothetical protein
MLHLLNTVLKQKFVVANADFTPDNLYSNDGKGVALYAAIMIMYLFRPNLKVGATLLEKWIEQVTNRIQILSDIWNFYDI